jgi:putative transposase
MSPASVYRVPEAAGRIGRQAGKPSNKGRGFPQPTKAHEHRHIDISYVSPRGTFYHLTTILDGHSRHIVHWGLGASMTQQDEMVILQRALEKHPG